MEVVKRIARWILSDEIHEIETKWFAYGVNQQYYEPDTCDHARVSPYYYWGEEE